MPSQTVENIYNYLRLSDSVGTGGQPTGEQVAALKQAGYKVVINLAPADSPKALPNEGELVTAQNMTYVHIPVVWEAPTAENLNQFFEAMSAHQDQKCFVHCIANMRVSAFTFLYRVIRQGVPLAEARKKMLQIWQPNPTWQKFIEETLQQHQTEP